MRADHEVLPPAPDGVGRGAPARRLTRRRFLAGSAIAAVGVGVAMNAPDGLAHWRASGRQSSTRRVNVVVLGEAIAQGLLATDAETGGYAALLRTALQQRFGDGGEGYVPAGDSYLLGSAIPRGAAGDRWRLDGTHIALRIGEMGVGAAALGVGMTWESIATRFAGDAVTVVVVQNPVGTRFGVTIDGRQVHQPQPFTSYGQPARLRQDYQITGLGRGTHELRVTNWGRYTVWLSGIIATRGGAGLVVHRAATARTTTESYRLSGVYNHVADPFGAILAPFAPDLTLIGFGPGDAAAGVAVARFGANLAAMAQAARAAGSDVVFVAHYAPPVGPYAGYAAYAAAIHAVARQVGAPVVDVGALWRHDARYAVAQGFVPAPDVAEPTDRGHRAIAAALLDLLLGPSRA